MMAEDRKMLEIAREIDQRRKELAAGGMARERQEQLWREGLHLSAQLRAIQQEAWAEMVRLDRLRVNLDDQGVAFEDLQITLQG